MDQVQRRLNNSAIHINPVSAQYNNKQIIRFVDRNEKIQYGHPVDTQYKQAIVINTSTVFDSNTPAPTSNEPVEIVKLLPPLQPTNVICIGLNYAKHAKESGMALPKYPIVFYKNVSALCAHNDTIVIPKQVQYKEQVDYEGELTIVIGKPCKDVSKEEALNYVYGYTIAHDVSARDWQLSAERSAGQWSYSKSFDTFCPLGPAITVASEIPNPQKLQVQTKVNGKMLQDMNTSDMIFTCAEIISFLSQGTTLTPGTIILTGTPEGVGMKREPPIWLKHGDKCEISISKLGTLYNDVVVEK